MKKVCKTPYIILETVLKNLQNAPISPGCKGCNGLISEKFPNGFPLQHPALIREFVSVEYRPFLPYFCCRKDKIS